MTKFLARLKVIATSAVTYITAAQAVIVVAADEISKVVAPEQAETIANVVVRLLAVTSAVVAILRRSIPAPADQRGILPPT